MIPRLYKTTTVGPRAGRYFYLLTTSPQNYQANRSLDTASQGVTEIVSLNPPAFTHRELQQLSISCILYAFLILLNRFFSLLSVPTISSLLCFKLILHNTKYMFSPWPTNNKGCLSALILQKITRGCILIFIFAVCGHANNSCCRTNLERNRSLRYIASGRLCKKLRSCHRQKTWRVQKKTQGKEMIDQKQQTHRKNDLSKNYHSCRSKWINL